MNVISNENESQWDSSTYFWGPDEAWVHALLWLRHQDSDFANLESYQVDISCDTFLSQGFVPDWDSYKVEKGVFCGGCYSCFVACCV